MEEPKKKLIPRKNTNNQIENSLNSIKTYQQKYDSLKLALKEFIKNRQSALNSLPKDSEIKSPIESLQSKERTVHAALPQIGGRQHTYKIGGKL